MSFLGDAASVLKTIIMVDEAIAALKESVKTNAAHLLDHEKRVVRIETMIEISRTPQPTTSRKGLPKP